MSTEAQQSTSASMTQCCLLCAVIPQSKEELLDCIHNLMAIIDTPVGRRKIKGEFADLVREQGRNIMESNGRSLYGA